MKRLMDYLGVFYSGATGLGIAISFLIAGFVFFVNTDHKRANRYLSACLVVSAMSYGLYGIYFGAPVIAYQAPHLVSYAPVLEMLVLPLTYLFIRHLYDEVFSYKEKTWLHFVPFAVVFALYMPVHFAELEFKLVILDTWFAGTFVDFTYELNTYYQFVGYANFLLYFFQLVLYVALLGRLHLKYQERIQEIFSETEQINLNWVLCIVCFWAAYAVIYFFTYILTSIEVVHFRVGNLMLITIQIFLFLYIGHQGLKHHFIYTAREQLTIKAVKEDKKSEDSTSDSDKKESTKYRVSQITEEQADMIRRELETLMQEQRPYLKSDLTITELAQMLGLKRYTQLSQYFSQYANDNFCNYINKFRIAEAKRRLQEDRKTSIIHLALDVGFNAPATFYRRFKQHTGMTPTQFQKELS